MNVTVIIASQLAILRVIGLFVEFDPLAVTLYKDVAHIFIGWLAATGWYDSRYEWGLYHSVRKWFGGGTDREYKWLFHAMCVVELVCFGLSRVL